MADTPSLRGPHLWHGVTLALAQGPVALQVRGSPRRSGDQGVGDLSECGGDVVVVCVAEGVDREIARGGRVSGLCPMTVLDAASAKLVFLMRWAASVPPSSATQPMNRGNASRAVTSVVVWPVWRLTLTVFGSVRCGERGLPQAETALRPERRQARLTHGASMRRTVEIEGYKRTPST